MTSIVCEMPRSHTTFDPVAMDVRVHSSNSRHHVNGSRKPESGNRARQLNDGTPQSLSREEEECIKFFEETINSLGELGEDASTPGFQPGLGSPRAGRFAPASSSPGSTLLHTSTPSSPKEQDIIDLVRQESSPARHREVQSRPANLALPNTSGNPEGHLEMKPRGDPSEEYSPNSTLAHNGPHVYHPPGSVPTPALVAQKIAEQKTNVGGSESFLPSILLARRKSLESPDHPHRHGPTPTARPNRYPANISVMKGNKDYNHNMSQSAGHLQERKAPTSINLPGFPCSPSQEEQRESNGPMRSTSFRDPTPDKSRMEALSKLGLDRERALSGGRTVLVTPPAAPVARAAESNAIHQEATTVKVSALPPAAVSKTEVDGSNFNSYGGRPAPTVIPKASPRQDPKPHLANPDVCSTDFNSYGGKTAVVQPTATQTAEMPLPPVSPRAKDSHSDFNPYGGKTKVLNLAPAPAARREAMHPAPLESRPKPRTTTMADETRNSGGRTRTPAASNSPDVATSSYIVSSDYSRTPKPAVTTAAAPVMAPRTPRQNPPASPQRVMTAASPPSPDLRRKSNPKPAAFRPQGITVQFLGRGATDETRRDALRRLGLLKEAH